MAFSGVVVSARGRAFFLLFGRAGDRACFCVLFLLFWRAGEGACLLFCYLGGGRAAWLGLGAQQNYKNNKWGLGFTWTSKVCKIIAFMAIIKGLGRFLLHTFGV